MKTLIQRIWTFAAAADGPIAVEYSVMLALIVMVCLTAIILIGSQTSTSFNNAAQSVGSP